MTKNEDFSKRMHKEILPIIFFPKGSPEEIALGKRIIASLLGDKLPDDRLPIGQVTPKQKYLGDIFRRYIEVKESFQRIELALIFVSKLPTDKKVSKLDYLRYHYEFYLNEMYIFELRVIQLLDYLIKECNQNNLPKDVEKLKKIKVATQKGMREVENRRGKHVHKRRLKNDKIDQISSLDSLSSSFEYMRLFRDLELKTFQKKLKKEIRDSLEALDIFFEKDLYGAIEPIIFTKLLNIFKTNV